MDDRAIKLVEFFKEIEKFKTVERKLWTSDLKRLESDADHAWHICMMILLMEKELREKQIDILHAMKLALTHDLGEIYTGDELAFTKNKERATIVEGNALKKLLQGLPKDLRNEIYDLWLEYEERKTPELKFVQALDKLEPVLQNLVSEGKSWKENNITFEMMFSNKYSHIEENRDHALLMEIYRQAVDQAKDFYDNDFQTERKKKN